MSIGWIFGGVGPKEEVSWGKESLDGASVICARGEEGEFDTLGMIERNEVTGTNVCGEVERHIVEYGNLSLLKRTSFDM